MVAIDTLGKIRPPGGARGRNAYEIDYEHLGRLQALFRDRTVALVVVHHASKEKRDDFLASVSGTYGITGSVDTIVVVERRRPEQTGKIHVTGRDVPDAEVRVMFDGLLWQESAEPVRLPEQFQEVLDAVDAAGQPVFPQAVATVLQVERKAAEYRLKKLVERGLLAKTERGYVVNRVVLKPSNPLNVPFSSSSSSSSISTLKTKEEEEEREGGTHTHARAAAREDDDLIVQLAESVAAQWASGRPCRNYDQHRSYHAKTPAGWVCRACDPGGEAA
jgi:hypothetical protein